MLLSTSSHLRQGPTHVMDTRRCPMPCPNPIEVVHTQAATPLLFLIGHVLFFSELLDLAPCTLAFPCSGVCSHRTLSCCSQDLPDPPTTLFCPKQQGEPVITLLKCLLLSQGLPQSCLPLLVCPTFHRITLMMISCMGNTKLRKVKNTKSHHRLPDHCHLHHCRLFIPLHRLCPPLNHPQDQCFL